MNKDEAKTMSEIAEGIVSDYGRTKLDSLLYLSRELEGQIKRKIWEKYIDIFENILKICKEKKYISGDGQYCSCDNFFFWVENWDNETQVLICISTSGIVNLAFIQKKKDNQYYICEFCDEENKKHFKNDSIKLLTENQLKEKMPILSLQKDIGILLDYDKKDFSSDSYVLYDNSVKIMQRFYCAILQFENVADELGILQQKAWW